MKNWYAVYTKPGAERKVVQTIGKLKIEVYCPHQWKSLAWNDRKRINIPLFPRYVFVRLYANDLAKVLEVEGVVNHVYWLDTPLIIRDIEIQMLQSFVQEYESLKVVRTSVSLTSMVGLRREQSLNNTANVKFYLVLPSLGFMLVAEDGSDNIEKADRTIINKNVFQEPNYINP